jgi:hypothetical protein
MRGGGKLGNTHHQTIHHPRKIALTALVEQIEPPKHVTAGAFATAAEFRTGIPVNEVQKPGVPLALSMNTRLEFTVP